MKNVTAYEAYMAIYLQYKLDPKVLKILTFERIQKDNPDYYVFFIKYVSKDEENKVLSATELLPKEVEDNDTQS